MNILQVQDALKNASDQQLAGELQNPTGMAPSYLVLSELKRRQQMRQGSQAAQAPQGSMAEEAAGAAEPEYYPEEQQQEQAQEEVPGIEAFREGGVVRMADGGLSEVPIEVLEAEYRRRNAVTPEPSRGFELPRWLRGGRREEPPPGTQRWTEPPQFPPGTVLPFGTPRNAIPAQTATREDLEAEISRRRAGSVGSSMEAETAPLRNFNPPRSQSVAPTEGQPSSELYGPPAPPSGQPVTAPSPTRAGAGIGGVAAQPAPQQEEGISSLYGRLRELSPSREEYRRDAANNALMQAGLAMMASKDPNALANLGAGGLRGLQTYTEEMKTGRAQQRQAIADEITARRANTEELYRRGLITNQERQLRLMEARMGQAAADRAETREMNREMRLEQINQRNVAALNSSLTSYASEINRLQIQLDNMTASDTRRQGLMNRLNQLQNETNIIRRRLAQAGGAEFDVVAPTQNPNAPPPGAPVEPLRIPGTR